MESRKSKRINIKDEFSFDDAWNSKQTTSPNKPSTLSWETTDQSYPPPASLPSQQPQQVDVGGSFVRPAKSPLAHDSRVRDDRGDYEDVDDSRRDGDRRRDIYRRRVSPRDKKRHKLSPSHSNHRSPSPPRHERDVDEDGRGDYSLRRHHHSRSRSSSKDRIKGKL